MADKDTEKGFSPPLDKSFDMTGGLIPEVSGRVRSNAYKKAPDSASPQSTASAAETYYGNAQQR